MASIDLSVTGLLDLIAERERESGNQSVLRFLEVCHPNPLQPLYTVVTSKVSGTSWETDSFSLAELSELPICHDCGTDLIDGETRLCSPCEAAEVMPLIRAFRNPL